MNQHPNYSDIELLDLIKPRIDYFMTLSGQYQKCDSETKQQQDCLTYQINTIQTIKELFYISSAIHDYLYKSVLMDKSVYSIFIADVPEELKKNASSNATPLIIFHIQTNITEIMRETFSIYNNIMPFLFQRGYFEEINDGFLAFFHDIFDFSFLFRQDNTISGAPNWFEKYYFKLPESFNENYIEWGLEKLRKIRQYNVI
jgi:hypothetical protein